MVLKATSNIKRLFKSSAAPLYHSLVTSLIIVNSSYLIRVYYLLYNGPVPLVVIREDGTAEHSNLHLADEISSSGFLYK